MAHGFRMKLPFGLLVAIAAVGCGGGSQVAAPPGVPVHWLSIEMLRLHGTASPTLARAQCGAAAPAKPANVLELEEDTRATMLLAAPSGEPALPQAMLHLTHLETNRTWCVVSQPDGTPASLGGEFPGGKYAVSVAEVSGAPPRRYEVRVEKL
jgi:hypothetical protein